MTSSFLVTVGIWLIWDLIVYRSSSNGNNTDFTDFGTIHISQKVILKQKVSLMQRQKQASTPKASSTFSAKAISDIQTPVPSIEIKASEIDPIVSSGKTPDIQNLGQNLDFSAFDLGEFSLRLKKAGAKKGHLTVSLIWENLNDLDLHCIGPDNEEIYFGNKVGKLGELDVDMNAGSKTSREPVENLYYLKPKKGKYEVYVNYFSNRGDPDPTEYMVWVRVKGKRDRKLKGRLEDGDPKKPIYTITIP